MIRKTVHNRRVSIFEIQQQRELQKETSQLVESIEEEWNKQDTTKPSNAVKTFEEELTLKEGVISEILSKSLIVNILVENEIDDIKMKVTQLSEEFVAKCVNTQKTFEKMSNTFGNIHLLTESVKVDEINSYVSTIKELCEESTKKEILSISDKLEEDVLESDSLITLSFKIQKEESLKEENQDFLLQKSSDVILAESVKYQKLSFVFGSLPLILKEDVSKNTVQHFFLEPLFELL